MKIFSSAKKILNKPINFFKTFGSKSKEEKTASIIKITAGASMLAILIGGCTVNKTSEEKPEKDNSISSSTVDDTLLDTPETTLEETTMESEFIGPQPVTTDPTENLVEDTIEDTTEVILEEDYQFISDSLDTEIVIEDNLDSLEDAEKVEAGEPIGAVDQNGNEISIDGNVSEDEIIEEVTYDSDVTIGPDGDAYVNGGSNNSGNDSNELDEYYLWSDGDYYNVPEDSINTDVFVDDTGTSNDELVDDSLTYEDENGELWVSKEDSDELTNKWLAPDGYYWDSEELYDSYISSLEEITIVPTDPEEENDYYKAPDGFYYVSEEEYNETINGLEAIEDCYIAPDGKNVWYSEQDYNDYIASLSTEVEPEKQPSEEVENIPTEPEQQPNEEVENTPTEPEQGADETGKGSEEIAQTFTAPDGSVWVSEADYYEYLEYINSIEEENTSAKTR